MNCLGPIATHDPVLGLRSKWSIYPGDMDAD